MQCFTNYSFAGQVSIVREVQLIAYDRLGYCIVVLNNIEYDVSSTYLYNDPYLKTRLNKKLFKVPRNKNDTITKLDWHNEIKYRRKKYFNHTQYSVCTSTTKEIIIFKNKKDALHNFAVRTDDCIITHWWRSLVERKNDILTITENKKHQSKFKIRHYKQYLKNRK